MTIKCQSETDQEDHDQLYIDVYQVVLCGNYSFEITTTLFDAESVDHASVNALLPLIYEKPPDIWTKALNKHLNDEEYDADFLGVKSLNFRNCRTMITATQSSRTTSESPRMFHTTGVPEVEAPTTFPASSESLVSAAHTHAPRKARSMCGIKECEHSDHTGTITFALPNSTICSKIEVE